MNHNAHFASDVPAGAMIGMTVGRAMVRRNDGERTEAAGKPVTFEPWVSPEGGGLTVRVTY